MGIQQMMLAQKIVAGGGAGATWDPAKKGSLVTLSSADMLATASGGTGSALATTGYTTGKYYWEVLCGGGGGVQRSTGLSRAGGATDYESDLGQEAGEYGWHSNGSGGNSYYAGSFGAQTGALYTDGDVVGMAVDFGLRRVWWHINGTYLIGNPATNTSPSTTYASGLGTMFAAASASTGGSMRLRTKAADFSYSIPAGFSEYG